MQRAIIPDIDKIFNYYSPNPILKPSYDPDILTKLAFRFKITESTSEIVSGDYGGQSSKMIYAVFTTPRNSISANAICAFRLRDLLDTFEGAFKEQETANSNWLPVPKIKEPKTRPGRCAADSTKLPESSTSFVKSHSIMDEAVPSFFGGRPLFVNANLQ